MIPSCPTCPGDVELVEVDRVYVDSPTEIGGASGRTLVPLFACPTPDCEYRAPLPS